MAARGKKTLAGVVGVAAAGILYTFVPAHEGEVLTTYIDPVGIATVCYGDTDSALAVPGASYSRAECLASLERQLIAHAEPVLEAVPEVAASPEMTAAFVSLAYNIGPGNFCRSTLVKKLNAKDYTGACREIKRWNRVGGKVLPGLTKRREKEYRLCMGN